MNILKFPDGCLSDEEIKGFLRFVEECKGHGKWRAFANSTLMAAENHLCKLLNSN